MSEEPIEDEIDPDDQPILEPAIVEPGTETQEDPLTSVNEVAEYSWRFRRLTPQQQGVIFDWCTSGENITKKFLAEKHGVTPETVYSWFQRQHIQRTIYDVTQITCTLADARGVQALTLLVNDLLRRVRKGEVNASNMKMEHLRLLEGCEKRMGGADMKLKMITESEGETKTLEIQGGGSKLSQIADEARANFEED